MTDPNTETELQKQVAPRVVKRDDCGRWLPGHSPNPGGYPKGHVRISDRLNALIAAPRRELDRVIRNKESHSGAVIAARLVKAAATSRSEEHRRRAAALILERLEGKPHQSVSLTADVVTRPPATILADVAERLNLLAEGQTIADLVDAQPSTAPQLTRDATTEHAPEHADGENESQQRGG